MPFKTAWCKGKGMPAPLSLVTPLASGLSTHQQHLSRLHSKQKYLHSYQQVCIVPVGGSAPHLPGVPQQCHATDLKSTSPDSSWCPTNQGINKIGVHLPTDLRLGVRFVPGKL
jgi:hypothetical protein